MLEIPWYVLKKKHANIFKGQIEIPVYVWMCERNLPVMQDKNLLGHLLLIGKNIAKSKKLKNWRTVINTGEESGQTVFHLHIHFLAGRKMSWPPG